MRYLHRGLTKFELKKYKLRNRRYATKSENIERMDWELRNAIELPHPIRDERRRNECLELFYSGRIERRRNE